MLTSKVGKEIVNCFDGKYDRYRLKQWSNKGILKCPVCGGNYEYCHGEIVPPYFRHVGKECSEYYSESETEEHRNGKRVLYDWISKQAGVTNCKLEYWIPETKQRPDIYFEYGGKRFVIEYQCTPIASEFLLRRELYKLAGINDIWILGTEKYNINVGKFGSANFLGRYRKIEKENMKNGLLYFESTKGILIVHSSFLINNHSLLKDLDDSYFMNKFYKENSKVFDTLGSVENFFVVEKVDNFTFNEGLKMNGDIIGMFNSLEKDLRIKWTEEQGLNLIEQEKIKQFNQEISKLKENSKYVGAIGENIDVIGRVSKSTSFRSWYGIKYVNEIVDDCGNVYTWFSPKSLSDTKRNKIKIRARIDHHREYLGVKQNIITNCKIIDCD
ncbi:competence protein CoiA [Metabacillus arenae]|uniref:Competence protein CoiA nuclease-like domain-containing protein n=1 Tax=Metabacillus arenae TaxID=2771434 RepID=A0A926NFS4_9BACI|nr:competence protein CoiA family protein [Metabacillus arenae]MBD1379193.1 hypothetical protein [Metabacillus arenae]